jgi:hypothetical protein
MRHIRVDPGKMPKLSIDVSPLGGAKPVPVGLEDLGGNTLVCVDCLQGAELKLRVLPGQFGKAFLGSYVEQPPPCEIMFAEAVRNLMVSIEPCGTIEDEYRSLGTDAKDLRALLLLAPSDENWTKLQCVWTKREELRCELERRGVLAPLIPAESANRAKVAVHLRAAITGKENAPTAEVLIRCDRYGEVTITAVLLTEQFSKADVKLPEFTWVGQEGTAKVRVRECTLILTRFNQDVNRPKE